MKLYVHESGFWSQIQRCECPLEALRDIAKKYSYKLRSRTRIMLAVLILFSSFMKVQLPKDIAAPEPDTELHRYE